MEKITIGPPTIGADPIINQPKGEVLDDASLDVRLEHLRPPPKEYSTSEKLDILAKGAVNFKTDLGILTMGLEQVARMTGDMFVRFAEVVTMLAQPQPDVAAITEKIAEIRRQLTSVDGEVDFNA